MNKQLMLALGAGATAVVAVIASAATLGGIDTDDLGADVEVVASCDNDGVTVDYQTEYDSTAGEYVVSDVDLSGIAAGCDTQDIEVTLVDGSDAVLGEGTAVATALGTATVAITPTTPVTDVTAAEVEGIAILISG